MIAFKPKTESASRVLLIAVILFNAVVPTKALAEPSSTLPQTDANNQSSISNDVLALDSQQAASIMESFAQFPIAFIPNVRQEDKDGVRFRAQGLGGNLFFTPEQIVFSLFNPVEVSSSSVEKEKKKIRYNLRPASILRITYVDASTQSEITGIEELPGVVNYLVGTDSSKWYENIPTYAGIAYHELYPGVELRYEGTGGNLKSTFHVAPGGNPAAILWKYHGADQVTIDELGNLVITLPSPADGEPGIVLTESAPVAWQDVDGNQVAVPVQYTLDRNEKVGFLFPDSYNPDLPLVIDPELTASTYLGGSKSDEGDAITVDTQGNIYVTGKTASSNFPTANPHQTNQPEEDIFVTKLDPLTRTILYSTYIGGSDDDHAWSIKLDSQGRITLVGETESSNFPVQNAFDTTYAGGSCGVDDPCDDVFVFQLETNGTTRRYGTYLGGAWDEEAFSLAIGPGDKIHLTGLTRSNTFPTTANGYDTSFGGGTCDGFPCEDAFVVKIDPALSGSASLLYSTFLGGSNYEKGRGIAVDANGHVYVTGFTRSEGLATPNAFQLARAGDSDIFVAKFDPTLSGSTSRLYTTYFGGDDSDHAYAMALNGANQVYFTGYTESPDFPSQNAFDALDGICGPDPDDFCLDAYVTHLDISTNTLVSSSYLGGSGDDQGESIAVDTYGNAYVTGYTTSTNFPLANEIQPLKGGDSCSEPPCADAFVTKVNPAGNAMVYSTYLGGDAEDYGMGIAVDALGGAYTVGYTYSLNFPVTNASGIASTTHQDVFVAKIFDPIPATPTPTSTSTSTPTATFTPTLTPTTVPPGVSCIDWRDADPHAWVQSPWLDPNSQVVWDSNGMYGSASTGTTYEVGAYFQMPAGGPYRVVFSGQRLANKIVAQGASAPTSSGPLSDVLPAGVDGSYSVSGSYLEVRWNIDLPINLTTTPLFEAFCMAAFTPTATPVASATSTSIHTATATFTPTQTPLTTCVSGQPDLFVDCALFFWTPSTSPSNKDFNNVVGTPACTVGWNTLPPSTSWNFVSLGGGNAYVIVDMGENEEIVDGTGPDFVVYETGSGCGGIDELYHVYVSSSPDGPWTSIGSSHGTEGFDLAGAVSQARYLKVVDGNANIDNGSTGGADIDGIEALHMASPIPTPTGPTPTLTNTPPFTPTATPTQPTFQEMVIPGWIGSPAQQATVSGIVPITLASGITLQSGTVDFWPVNDLSQLKVLATVSNKNGGDTLATLDTTTLANGSYVIRLQGTDNNSNQQDSGIMITVSGEYKPGRVRFTITDLTIPVAGLPITIARTYDSLERSQVADFGYGWTLDVGNPKLETNLAHDVTITMPDGRRSTFYFTPGHYSGVFSYFMYPNYTPEAGVYGSLTSNGCNLIALSGGQYFCFLEGEYQPTEYTYTDPYGRKFLMDAEGTLNTITDLNNNVLTFSPNGITSSAGNINVPFERDTQGRIKKITYPAGKEYVYEYKNEADVDTGELRKVTFPSVTLLNNSQQAIVLKYDYYADHFFKEATDPRGYKPVITTYDSSGRIESVTDAAGNKTTYEYDLVLRKTTVHYLGDPANPNDNLGDAVLIYDEAGYLISYTNPLSETTLYEYDPSTHKLIKVTDPLTHATRYTYNTNGHPTSIIDPLNKTLGTVQYNQYGGPTTLTTVQGGSATVQYDPVTFMPLSASDNLGSLGGYTWTPQGNPATHTDQYGKTTNYNTYTPQGYLELKTDPLGNKTHYLYNQFGQVTDITVAYQTSDASTTHYTYDELGRQTEVTIAYQTTRAATTKYEYDANGNRTAVVDPLGRRTEYQYDAANRLEFVTYAAGTALASTTQYKYDFYSRLIDVIVALGTADESTTHYSYYDNGLQKDVTVAFGKPYASTTHHEYYADGRVKDVTVAYGTVDAATTHYAYDAAGRTTNVTIASGTADASTTHYEYHDSGLLKSTTTAFGTNLAATTLYFYDSRGRPTVTQYPDGTNTSQAYDIDPNAAGWVDSITDQAGVTTKYVYDEAGRLDQLITAAFDPSLNQTLQHTTNYEYDGANRLTDTFDPLNHRTSFTYYPTGQMATSKSWLNATTGYTTTFDYNTAGEQISVTDANNHITQYQYNERGLPKKTIYPPTAGMGEIATSQTYDAAGRLLTSTDENGIVTRNAYNAAGQLISVTLGYGTTDATTIQYGYNFAGQLTSLTDAKSHVTTFQYNDAGQQVKKILPDTTTYEQFGYNAAGNMVSHRLEDGNTNTFRYDRMNRLTDIVYFDGRSIVFEYTNGGQRKKASLYPQPLSVPQVYNYTYDPFQRLKQVTYPDGRAVSYTYYDNDQRASMTTPAGTVSYTYNNLDQLISVTSGTQTTTYQYDPAGFLTQRLLPNGVKTVYTPNERDQLKNVTVTNASNTTLLSFAYDLDKAGNRTKVTELGGSTITWGYDTLYRLTSEVRRNNSNAITWQAGFTYDAAGNRASMTVNAATTTYQYNALDQLTSAGSITYNYDGRGNLNKITNGTQITNYTYNAADQLSNVVLPNSTNITYGYDADGRRVKQTAGSTVTNYLWDEASTYGDVVLEYNGSGTTVARYVLGGTGLISQTRGTTTSYFLEDGQGSTRALTSSTGAVTDTYSYTAFGETFSSTGTTVNPYRYTGQQFDSLTGLYNLRARYYNSGLGRFLSQDTHPVNFGNPVELNRYVYTGNNPINLIDPTGHEGIVGYALRAQQNVTIGRSALTPVAFYAGAVVLGFVIGLTLGQEVDTPPQTGLGDAFEEWMQQFAPGGGGPRWGRGIITIVSILALISMLANPNVIQNTIETGPQPKKPDDSFDIAFGRFEYLGVFAGMLTFKINRTVLPFNLWAEKGLSASPADNTLPNRTLIQASQYVGGAQTWSLRFPEAQYPEAKIRFNLWKIEEGYRPRITLGEYYLLKQRPMLWRRVVFYEYTHTDDHIPYPTPLTGQALNNRLLQIESSPNYRKLQSDMENNVP